MDLLRRRGKNRRGKGKELERRVVIVVSGNGDRRRPPAAGRTPNPRLRRGGRKGKWSRVSDRVGGPVVLFDRDARWTVRSSRTARIARFRTLASSWADGPKAQRPPAAGPVTRRACGAERKRPWAASAGCAPRTRGTQRNGPWAESEKLWYGPHVLIRVFPLFFVFPEAVFNCFCPFFGQILYSFFYTKYSNENFV